MKTNLLFSLLLSIFLFNSCEKDKPISSYTDTFHFNERDRIIHVSHDIDSFHLTGILGKSYHPTEKVRIIIVPELTTAVKDIHYLLPENLIFTFTSDSLKQQIKIGLIPENITSPIKIVFTSESKIYNQDYSNMIDTTIINLIPVIK